MRTGFDDLPMIHDMDAVEIPNRCESVRHDDARTVSYTHLDVYKRQN